MNGIIVMKLNSDTCVGTGESVGGIVDVEIQYDEYGIPYIPGKRIKGILREEASELAALSGMDTCAVDELFGKPGGKDSCDLWIGNGEIDDKEAFLLQLKHKKGELDKIKKGYSSLLNPNMVTDMFTTLRAQTAINDNGVADEDTLRVSRVIRRGHIFRFPVSIKSSHSNTQLFKDAVRCLRHVGTNRNRGFGWVSCDWTDCKSDGWQAQTPELTGSSERMALQYKLELLSDCILDKQYIPGGTILGMAASAFLRKYTDIDRGNAHKHPVFADIFLGNSVYFGNAHPCGKDLSGIPVPLSLACEKGKQETLFNRFVGIDSKKQYERPDFEFCSIKKDCIIPIKTQSGSHFHHKRAQDKAIGNAGEDGKFFQYDCVAASTVFSGEISGPKKYIELLKSLLDKTEVFIGKSRSAQYGRCKFICENTINETDCMAKNGSSPISVGRRGVKSINKGTTHRGPAPVRWRGGLGAAQAPNSR